jgi:hypothetical protein
MGAPHFSAYDTEENRRIHADLLERFYASASVDEGIIVNIIKGARKLIDKRANLEALATLKREYGFPKKSNLSVRTGWRAVDLLDYIQQLPTPDKTDVNLAPYKGKGTQKRYDIHVKVMIVKQARKLRAQGLTYNQIGEELGTTGQSIRNWLKEFS